MARSAPLSLLVLLLYTEKSSDKQSRVVLLKKLRVVVLRGVYSWQQPVSNSYYELRSAPLRKQQ
eukprot:7347-Heterococcus_DN1.PRE.3